MTNVGQSIFFLDESDCSAHGDNGGVLRGRILAKC